MYLYLEYVLKNYSYNNNNNNNNDKKKHIRYTYKLNVQ